VCYSGVDMREQSFLRLGGAVRDYYDQHKSSVLKRVRGHVKLLAEPKFYAQGAIDTLKSQLETVKSPKRRRRLESKLEAWSVFLDSVEKKEKEDEQKVESDQQTQTGADGGDTPND
jgi:hypothetical protein